MSTSTTNLKVKDVALPTDKVPVVGPRAMLKEALECMNAFRLGIVAITDGQGHLLGIFTDGDVRRMLLKDQKPFSALFADDAITHAVRKPTTCHPDMPLKDAVQLMEDRQIWDLPVVDADNVFIGMLHLHPAAKALLGI